MQLSCRCYPRLTLLSCQYNRWWRSDKFVFFVLFIHLSIIPAYGHGWTRLRESTGVIQIPRIISYLLSNTLPLIICKAFMLLHDPLSISHFSFRNSDFGEVLSLDAVYRCRSHMVFLSCKLDIGMEEYLLFVLLSYGRLRGREKQKSIRL